MVVNFRSLFSGKYINKKVVVTGHTGFKGSWLTLWLIMLGANVCGFSKNIPTNPSLFNLLRLKNKIKHVIGDIENYDKFKKTIISFRPDVIFHLAAQSLVKKSYENPIKTFQTNSLGTLNVLQASNYCKNLKALILITSDKVYKNIEIKRGYRENDILMGNDPYSASKSCAEIIINMHIKSFKKNKKITILRAGNIIGGGDWAPDRIFPDLIKKIFKNKILRIRSPHATRPWQHVLEPLSAYLYVGSILLSKNYKKVNLDSFNVGPKKNVNKSVLSLLKEVKKNIANLKYIVKKSKNFKEAKLLRLNCNKINKKIGWKPLYGFTESIKYTCLWYLQYLNIKKNLYEFSINQIEEYVKKGIKNNVTWIK
jgi:CDP-glucose 4,6-dehydratase